MELSETEKLFAHPLHPYTRALLSAIPMPDPESEREKVLEVYDPSCHHYETDKPVWTEIEPGHFIMANQEELAEYRKQLENNWYSAEKAWAYPPEEPFFGRIIYVRKEN